MDPNQSGGHDSALKRSFDEGSTSTGEDESFNLKKVKREPGVNEGDDKVLLLQLQLNRVPEMTPVHHAKSNIKLELKSENGFPGYDSTPANSESPSPFDMGKSYEKLIEKGRVEFIKVREKIESERAAQIESSRSTYSNDTTTSWSSWWTRQKNQALEKMDNERENLPKLFCFRCKRYGHNKPKCRNPFQYRYPQKYLNEHPGLREKLREAAIRRRVKKQGNERFPWQPHHPRPHKFPISTFNPKESAAYPPTNLLPPSTNSLQLNQISEILNQILKNQKTMMEKQQTLSNENFDVKPTNYNNRDNKPWNNNQSKKPWHNNRYHNYRNNRI